MNDQKKRKFKGSVLFTVVFVMSILIVLLMGTLTLAYATNSRAHVNYSSAQTGITSRLVTESSIQAINGNEDYAKAVASLNGTTNRGPLKVRVGLSSDNSAAALGTMGHGDDQHDIYADIEYAGTKKYYDVTDGQWYDRDLLRFTSTVSQGGVDKTSTAYVLKHFKNDNTGGSSGGAGFVTTSGATVKTQTSLYGGSYVNLPDWKNKFSTEYGTDEWSFYSGLSAMDETKRGFKNLNTSDYDNTSLHLTNSSGVLEADTYIYDNLAIENWSGFYFPDKGTGVTVWGDFYAKNANCLDHLQFIEGDKLKDYDSNHVSDPANFKQIKFNEIPYLYINGKIHGSSDGGGAKMGLGAKNTDAFPLNVFCGSIDSSNFQEFLLSADLYCMDATGTNKLGRSDKTSALYSWTASVINQTEPNIGNYVSGKVCSNSDLELTNITINGDVRVNGNCRIKDSVTINGNLIVAGTLSGDLGKLSMGDGRIIYCNDVRDLPLTSSITEENYILQFSKVHDDSIHPNDADHAIEVENEWREYYKHTINNIISVQREGWVEECGEGIHGEAISNKTIGDVVYYEWESWYNPYDENNDKSIIEHYVSETRYDYGLPDNKDTYLCMTKVKNPIEYDDDGNVMTYATSEKTDKEKYFYDIKKNGIYTWKEKVNKDGGGTGEYTDKDYTWYRKSDGLEVTDADVNAANTSLVIDKLDVFTNTGKPVYPKYAERSVLLGLDPDPSIDKKETKVVKTIKEVIEGVANPYDYNSAADITDISSAYALLPTKDKTRTSGDNNYFTLMKELDNDGSNYIIDESCVLNIEDDIDKPIMIKPGAGNLLVVIEKLSVQAGKQIIVDDTAKGKVYFYIEEGGSFTHSGNACIATKTYSDQIDDASKTTIKYNSPSKTADIDLNVLGKPRFFIFGGENSKMNLSNMNYIAGNIISPHTEVSISGGTLDKFTAIYYDDLELGSNGLTRPKGFIFGCLNAKSTDIPNTFGCIYVTDGAGGSGAGDAYDDIFWYKVLYFTEY